MNIRFASEVVVLVMADTSSKPFVVDRSLFISAAFVLVFPFNMSLVTLAAPMFCSISMAVVPGSLMTIFMMLVSAWLLSVCVSTVLVSDLVNLLMILLFDVILLVLQILGLGISVAS